MKKTIWIGIVIVFIIAAIYIIQIINEKNIVTESNTVQNPVKSIASNTVKTYRSLFLVAAYPDDFIGRSETGADAFSRYLLTPIDENRQLYDSLSPKNANQSTIVIIPIFTSLAYSDHGFYDYYDVKCNEECLTVNAVSAYSKLKFDYSSSAMANQVFEILGYDRISDADVNKDPSILAKYDRVILLHSEYVTKKMFDAITNHPKVSIFIQMHYMLKYP